MAASSSTSLLSERAARASRRASRQTAGAAAPAASLASLLTKGAGRRTARPATGAPTPVSVTANTPQSPQLSKRRATAAAPALRTATAVRAAAASSRLPLDNEGFASILSFLASPDVGAARLSARELNLGGRVAADRCTRFTGPDGEHCVTALRAAAPSEAVAGDDPEDGLSPGGEGKEGDVDAAERRGRAFALLRERMRALGAGCADRCAELLAPRAARGIAALQRIAVAEGKENVARQAQDFPARPLPPPTRERYLRGGDPNDPYGDDDDKEDAAPEHGGLVRVRRTAAEARALDLTHLPAVLTRAEAAAQTEVQAIADSEAADGALYGTPHLGGRLSYVSNAFTFDLTVDVPITPDELLQLAQAPAVVRVQQARRDDKSQATANRDVDDHILVTDVIKVLRPARAPPTDEVRRRYVDGGAVQALAREVAARAVPTLRALLLALAPYVRYIVLTASGRDPDGRPYARTSLMRDERYPVNVAFAMQLYDSRKFYNYLDTTSAATAAATKRLAASRAAAAERRLVLLLPALSAAAPAMVREWVRFSETAPPLSD